MSDLLEFIQHTQAQTIEVLHGGDICGFIRADDGSGEWGYSQRDGHKFDIGAQELYGIYSKMESLPEFLVDE